MTNITDFLLKQLGSKLFDEDWCNELENIKGYLQAITDSTVFEPDKFIFFLDLETALEELIVRNNAINGSV